MLLYIFPLIFKVISPSYNQHCNLASNQKTASTYLPGCSPSWRWWRPSATLTSPSAGWIPSKVDFIKVSCLDSVTKVTFWYDNNKICSILLFCIYRTCGGTLCSVQTLVLPKQNIYMEQVSNNSLPRHCAVPQDPSILKFRKWLLI